MANTLKSQYGGSKLVTAHKGYAIYSYFHNPAAGDLRFFVKTITGNIVKDNLFTEESAKDLIDIHTA